MENNVSPSMSLLKYYEKVISNCKIHTLIYQCKMSRPGILNLIIRFIRVISDLFPELGLSTIISFYDDIIQRPNTIPSRLIRKWDFVLLHGLIFFVRSRITNSPNYNKLSTCTDFYK